MRLTIHARILARLGDGPTATILLTRAFEINNMKYGRENPITQAARALMLQINGA